MFKTVYSRMRRRWPAESGAATAAGTGVVRLEDAATNGSARALLGCDCRSDRPSAAARQG